MNNETPKLEVNKIYSLDLGSLAPVEVKVLELMENGVLCEYLHSTPGRVEVLDYYLLDKNPLLH